MTEFIVFGGSSVIVTAVLRAIRCFTNANIIVLGDHDTQSLRWSMLYKKHINICLNGRDDEYGVDVLNVLASKSPKLLLIPCDCDAIRMTNRISHRLAVNIIPIPDSVTLDMFDDKWLFYQFCQRHDLPMPDTMHIGAKQDLNFDATAAKLGLPFIVKPSNQAGSMGVLLIHSSEQYENTVRVNPDYAFKDLIAQRYIDGTDIDISLYSVRGNLSAFAIQQSEKGKINFLTHPELKRIAEIVCKESAYHGVMHLDARIDRVSGKIYLIECNPRFWASLTAAIWCGLNFVKEIVTCAPDMQPVRQLTSGTAILRSAFTQPSSWTSLLFDGTERGRLLRSMTFDLPAIGSFAKRLSKLFRFRQNKVLSR